MLFPAATVAGIPCRLLLIRPNLSQAKGHVLEYTHTYKATIGEGRTSIEERYSEQPGIVLSQKCTIPLFGAWADDWRKGLVELGNLEVAMPVWIDALPVARWEDRVYEAEYVVNFDPKTGDFAIYHRTELSTSLYYPLLAPLMLGRWTERPPAEANSPKYGWGQVAIEETSPWSSRIAARSAATEWTARPNYLSGLRDVSQHGLELLRLAPGVRTPALDRTNTYARWLQEASFGFASRDSVRDALGCWQHARGPWGTFPVPAWFQPGIATGATPDSYTARFAQDALTVTWTSGAFANARVSFLQEVPTPSRPQQRPRRAYLYKLTYQHDLTNQELWTSWAAPLSLPEGTYTPWQVWHKEIVRSLKPQDDRAEIHFAHKEGSLSADWPLGRLYGWVSLAVYQCDPDSPATTRGAPIFSGFIDSVDPQGNDLTIEASVLNRFLKRDVPFWTWGATCNTYAFSSRCCLAEAEHRSLATLTRANLRDDGKTVTLTGADGWGGPAYEAQWFGAGLLRTGERRSRMIVTIGASEMSGDALVLTLNRPLWPDLISEDGQVVELLPGCYRRYEIDCGNKFANQHNFRACPYVPDYLETPTATAAKK